MWTLGCISLLTALSSQMIHALLSLYTVTGLGTSALAAGIIEGVAEATASITKVFSGTLSDWLGQRKRLAAAGYGLAAFTKPVFALAPSVAWLFAARFVDRIGKGIRGAPRIDSPRLPGRHARRPLAHSYPVSHSLNRIGRRLAGRRARRAGRQSPGMRAAESNQPTCSASDNSKGNLEQMQQQRTLKAYSMRTLP